MIRRPRIVGFRGSSAIGIALTLLLSPRSGKWHPRPASAGRGCLPSAAPWGPEPDEGGDVWVLTGEQAERGGNLSPPRDAELHAERVAVCPRRPGGDPEGAPHLVVRAPGRDQRHNLALADGQRRLRDGVRPRHGAILPSLVRVIHSSRGVTRGVTGPERPSEPDGHAVAASVGAGDQSRREGGGSPGRPRRGAGPALAARRGRDGSSLLVLPEARFEVHLPAGPTRQRGASSAACGSSPWSTSRTTTWTCPCGCIAPPITPNGPRSAPPSSSIPGMIVWKGRARARAGSGGPRPRRRRGAVLEDDARPRRDHARPERLVDALDERDRGAVRRRPRTGRSCLPVAGRTESGRALGAWSTSARRTARWAGSSSSRGSGASATCA